MTSDLDMHDLAQQIARLEERMETKQAEYRTDIARLAETMAQRDKDNQRWVVGFGIAQMVLIVAILAAGFAFLGILIGLPT